MYYEDSVIEQSTTHLLLRRLLPLLCLLPMVDTLNRLTLDYAALPLGSALHLSDGQLRFADILFYLGVIAASLPAAWLLLLCGAPRLISGIVLAGGFIAIAHALVRGAGSLYTIHLLLGVAEAGLFPAMVFYLAAWMPERQRATSIATLVAAASLVPLVAGHAADLILLLGQWFDITDWRFLFLVLGLPSLWIGGQVPWGLPLAPADASWLPASERTWLLDRLRRNVPSPAVETRLTDGARSVPMRKLAAMHGVIGLVGGSLGMWVPLAMQRTDYMPPDEGAVIMITAAVVGALVTVVAGLLLHRRSHCCWALAVCFALTGLCLAGAAVLPSGTVAVVMMAVVAGMTPVILALTWVLAPCILAGAAAAAGFAVLAMGGALGDLGAIVLATLRHDANTRCMVLALACFAAAWLARKLESYHPAEVTASAASPGE